MPGTLQLPKGWDLPPAQSGVPMGAWGLDSAFLRPCHLRSLCPVGSSALLSRLQPHLFLLTSHLAGFSSSHCSSFLSTPKTLFRFFCALGGEYRYPSPPRIISIGSMGTLPVPGRGAPSLISLAVYSLLIHPNLSLIDPNSQITRLPRWLSGRKSSCQCRRHERLRF